MRILIYELNISLNKYEYLFMLGTNENFEFEKLRFDEIMLNVFGVWRYGKYNSEYF